METYELIHVEWSDYGVTVDVLATVEAANINDAAHLFRHAGWGHYLYVRKRGEHISKPLCDL